ncbi:MAG: rhomboid family intramembrane serine protease [Desulfobulbaceae bacterium]|nr:rhomboid family intramembrane serine protease [Desulfobulbaceae bacterium]
MLVVPIISKLKQHSHPFITIGLILINCLVYFYIQGDEDSFEIAAYEYYNTSGLMNMEVRAYEQYLLSNGNIGGLPDPVTINTNQDLRIQLYFQMRGDDDFVTSLLNFELIKITDTHFLSWQKLRKNYEEKLALVISNSYGYTPSKATLLTAFTSMFLHGGFMHLLGNMVFLWLVGSMVEAITNRAAYLFGYLLTGILAAWSYGFIYSTCTTPLVGASGAISGIMGAYCVLYGLSKVKVFISLGFYFNTLRLPAIALLPFWLAKELYSVQTIGDISNVAYIAHFGGLLAGATLAFSLIKIQGPINIEDQEETMLTMNADLEKGVQYMAELELDKAREVFNRLLTDDPKNIEVLEKLFETESLGPNPASLHRTANSYLKHLANTAEHNYKRLLDTYIRYAQLCRNDLQLSPVLLLTMLILFCKKGEIKEATAIASTLVKKHSDSPKLPRALLHLSIAADKNNMPKVGSNCRTLLQRKFPQSSEYARAMEVHNSTSDSTP